MGRQDRSGRHDEVTGGNIPIDDASWREHGLRRACSKLLQIDLTAPRGIALNNTLLK
jgi:hypothetical protein